MHLSQPGTTSFVSSSTEMTVSVARELASSLKPGDILTLEGPLGAGKTTFTKGLISSLAEIDESEIASPTFTYLSVYEALFPIHHFDAYRIEREEFFAEMGLADYINETSISVIEWPSKIPSYTLAANVQVKIEYVDETKRKIEISRYNR